MAAEREIPLAAEEKRELAALFNEAVTRGTDREVKALIAGLNFRVDVFKAFKAVWYTTKVCVKTAGCVLAGTTSPVEVLEIAYGTYQAVTSTIQALVERMTPLEYTACVYLSSVPEPITSSEFQSQLTAFLVSGKVAELPWYMAMTRNRLEASLKDLEVPDGFDDLLTKLRKNDWLVEENGKLKFKSRHYKLDFEVG